MSFVFALIKLLGINQKSFFKSLKTFKGMPHRYEIFLKKKIVFLLMTPRQHHFKQLNVR